MQGSSAGEGGAYNTVNLNLYHYAGNNPIKYIDPNGRVVDTVWDVGFTLYDIGSALYKSSNGDHSGWVDVGIDVICIIVPGLPAGISKIDDAVKFARTTDKASDVVKITKSADKISNASSSVKTAKELHRPYIRKSTRSSVENTAKKNAKGQFLDANTGMPIDGKYDLGHKYGHEFRKEKRRAEREGLTQKEFNDRMNNPDLYQIELPSSNRSHKYEEP